jgi:hypothetical protein
MGHGCLDAYIYMYACGGFQGLHGSTSLGAVASFTPSLTLLGVTGRFARLARPGPALVPCPGGGIGRRAGFRYQWSDPWRFESSPGHHSLFFSGEYSIYHHAKPYAHGALAPSWRNLASTLAINRMASSHECRVKERSFHSADDRSRTTRSPFARKPKRDLVNLGIRLELPGQPSHS